MIEVARGHGDYTVVKGACVLKYLGSMFVANIVKVVLCLGSHSITDFFFCSKTSKTRSE